MYMIDANLFMNWVLGIILATGAVLFAATLGLAAIAGKTGGRAMSYLYMLTTLFGLFAVVVAVLGVRGQTSGNRPWHFFLDMKYQPKYTSQGQSRFFADGRSNRLPRRHAMSRMGWTKYSCRAMWAAGTSAPAT